VFLLTSGPDGPRQDQIMASAAAGRALAHLVKLSVLGITEGATDPITQWHREGEDALLRSGVPSSFVRPGAFMSNALNWAPSIAAYASVQAPFGDLPVACVDPVDIAAVAYHLLVRPGPAGAGYPVTGPEAISPKGQAAVLADLLGKTVRFTGLSAERARDQMIQYGMPALLADAVIASMGSPRLGRGQTPLPTVEDVTGLRPRGFRDWAAAHLAAFVTPAANW
jgi:uncharacterized protein YbjT (DUF2867 family)